MDSATGHYSARLGTRGSLDRLTRRKLELPRGQTNCATARIMGGDVKERQPERPRNNGLNPVRNSLGALPASSSQEIRIGGNAINRRRIHGRSRGEKGKGTSPICITPCSRGLVFKVEKRGRDFWLLCPETRETPTAAAASSPVDETSGGGGGCITLTAATDAAAASLPHRRR